MPNTFKSLKLLAHNFKQLKKGGLYVIKLHNFFFFSQYEMGLLKNIKCGQQIFMIYFLLVE